MSSPPPAPHAYGHPDPHAALASLYRQRNQAAQLAAALAKQLGLHVGLSTDTEAHDWPTLYILLPSGQVSWHIEPADLWPAFGPFEHPPEPIRPEDKSQRIRNYVTNPTQQAP